MTAQHPTPEEDRLGVELDAVEAEIDDAEEAHDEAQAKPEGQLWVDSGTVRPDLDDQTIAPPG